MKPLYRAVVMMALIFCACSGNKTEFQYGKSVSASSAMVVSAHPEASRIGAEIIAAGGNAVDAAVAVEFSLAVCYPVAGNIGGGGFMIIRMADGSAACIDYREKAPSAASRDMYLDSVGEVIEGLSLNTHLSAGIPGTVDGLLNAHDRYGKLGLKRILQPAIVLAEKGFAVTSAQAESLNRMRPVFLERNSAPVRFVRERPWQEGDTLRQPELASTLRRISELGRDGFYEGTTAAMIVAESSRGNGIITADDLRNYRSCWREPLVTEYRDYKVISPPPPSSGGVVLFQLLGMTELFDSVHGNFHDPEEIHFMVEAEKRAYADRAHYLGDPDFTDIPVAGLISSDYLRSRMDRYSSLNATPSAAIAPGVPLRTESEETTHYSIVDDQGNAVSGTTTLNNSYGSAIVVEGAGFILNDEMDDFSVKPGTPNMYGLVGGEANAIAPGKRMLSSMTPTIIEKNNRVFMVVGSPGGSTIITSVYQVIRNVTDYNMSIADAVAMPRFHHQWLPDMISYETNGIDSLTISLLKEKGHSFSPRSSIGRVDAILIDSSGVIHGGADPRGDDTAVGW